MTRDLILVRKKLEDLKTALEAIFPKLFVQSFAMEIKEDDALADNDIALFINDGDYTIYIDMGKDNDDQAVYACTATIIQHGIWMRWDGSGEPDDCEQIDIGDPSHSVADAVKALCDFIYQKEFKELWQDHQWDSCGEPSNG